MLVVLEVIDTVGVTELVTVNVTALLMDLLVVWQLLLLVITTLIMSLLAGAVNA